MVITLWLVSILIFSLSRAFGDPRNMYLQRGTTQAMWDAWGREFGLDRPLPVQYLVWFGKMWKGDFGISLYERRSVLAAIWDKLPNSLYLAFIATLMAMLGIPLGVIAAVKRGTIWDTLVRLLAVVNQATPPFWTALVLILIFAVQLNWLPAGKMGGPKHWILPLLTLGGFGSATLLRLTRSSLLETLDQEYIKLARAKGVSGPNIIWKHAFRNALIAPLNTFGFFLAGLTTGTVVVETVFGWPGVGRLAVQSTLQNDFPLLSALVLFGCLMYVVAMLFVDVVQAIVDPRIRYT